MNLIRMLQLTDPIITRFNKPFYLSLFHPVTTQLFLYQPDFLFHRDTFLPADNLIYQSDLFCDKKLLLFFEIILLVGALV